MRFYVKNVFFVLITISSLFFLLPGSSVFADSSKPFVSPLFSDHMVLQRDVEGLIWGWTSPGEKVTVEILGNTSACTADSSGKWTAKIKSFSKGGPYKVNITGSKSVTLSDVYFGDVWFCAGQSNMQMQLPFSLNGDTEVKNSANPNVRFFTTPYGSGSTPADNFGYVSNWYVSGPDSVGNLSAVAYYFAKELTKEIDVPIGIVCSTVGGSQIESWMSDDALKKFVDSANTPGYSISQPSEYYNGMVAPIEPLKLKGVVWYQGESNTNYASLYEKQLDTLVLDWRSGFGQVDLPFIIIELPAYSEVQESPVQHEPWNYIREGQLNVSRSLNNVGLVVTTDIGDVDIHPKNKTDVGLRTAYCAVGRFYGKGGDYTGPLYAGMSTEGSKIRLKFENAASGLMAGKKTGTDPVQEVVGGKLSGFAIAGADGQFVWADAVIDGSDVVVSSSSVSAPKTVRYSWASNPLGNLYNKAGFPASPFRTDGAITPTPTKTVIKGDVNDDGNVNSTDCSLLKRYLLEQISELPSSEGLTAADMNEDSEINSTDYVLLKRYVLQN